MSAAGHEQAAQAEADTAARHQAEYDPSAKATAERCRPQVGGRGGLGLGAVCWTSITNPTEAHLRQAEEHRRMAADHRAASAALAEAEARSCDGISPDDRDISPFEHVEDVVSVEPLKERVQMGRSSSERIAGALITIRAVPGITGAWLQRIVDCHLARNASLGNIVPEMINCPLVPKGAEARVTSVKNGFAVAIRSDDDATAKEILARAQRLVPATTHSSAPVAP